jgi:hypothetical protein
MADEESDFPIVTASAATFATAPNVIVFLVLAFYLNITTLRNKLNSFLAEPDVFAEWLPVPWPGPQALEGGYHWFWVALWFVGLSSNGVAMYFSWETAFDDPTLGGDQDLVRAFFACVIINGLSLCLLFVWVKYLLDKRTFWIAAIRSSMDFTVAFTFAFISWWTSLLSFTFFAVGLYAVYFSSYITWGTDEIHSNDFGAKRQHSKTTTKEIAGGESKEAVFN